MYYFSRLEASGGRYVRSLSTTPKPSAMGHYNSLGITPKATQGEVKSAYYKLSMLYHPDRNQGSVDAANKFRDITAAYEVLGNIRLRKLYDKGIDIRGGDRRPHEEEPIVKFYGSRERRSQPPGGMGRTPYYDFDEWSRAHYGTTFSRDMARKRSRQAVKQNTDALAQQNKLEFVSFVMMCLIIAFILFERDNAFDEVKIRDDPVDPKPA